MRELLVVPYNDDIWFIKLFPIMDTGYVSVSIKAGVLNFQSTFPSPRIQWVNLVRCMESSTQLLKKKLNIWRGKVDFPKKFLCYYAIQVTRLVKQEERPRVLGWLFHHKKKRKKKEDTVKFVLPLKKKLQFYPLRKREVL